MKVIEPTPSSGRWWSENLGKPASAGSKDGMRYAFFPEKHLLLIEEDGKVKTFDSGHHRISGVSHGTREARSLAFTSAHGPVRIQNLKRLA